MKTLVVVNPKARAGKAKQDWSGHEKEVLSALGEDSVETCFTTPEDHGAGAVRAALKNGARKIVVVGGDGTVSEAVQGFFENGRQIAPDATLAILPAGRGDDFMKSVAGKSAVSSQSAWEQGLDLIRKGTPKPVDVGAIEFLVDGGLSTKRYFINIASFGYTGLVTSRVHDGQGLLAKTIIGKSAWTYLAQSALALKDYDPMPAIVRVDGAVAFEGPLFMGYVLNGRYNAGGVSWSQDAKIDDGVFHLLFFKAAGVLKTIANSPRQFHRMMTGDWSGLDDVTLAKGRIVSIEVQEASRRKHPLFEIDGDQPEPAKTSGAVIENLAGAISVLR